MLYSTIIFALIALTMSLPTSEVQVDDVQRFYPALDGIKHAHDIDPKLVDEALSDREVSSRMVDCVLEFTDTCPQFLKRFNEIAPNMFANAGRCTTCGRAEQSYIRNFLMKMAERQPFEYFRLIEGLSDAGYKLNLF